MTILELQKRLQEMYEKYGELLSEYIDYGIF